MRRLFLTILLSLRYADIPHCWHAAGVGIAWKRRAAARTR